MFLKHPTYIPDWAYNLFTVYSKGSHGLKVRETPLCVVLWPSWLIVLQKTPSEGLFHHPRQAEGGINVIKMFPFCLSAFFMRYFKAWTGNVIQYFIQVTGNYLHILTFFITVLRLLNIFTLHVHHNMDVYFRFPSIYLHF